MLVAKLTSYVLVFPVEVEDTTVTGVGAGTLSALTAAATGTFTALPDEGQEPPAPPVTVVRLRVDLMGTERRAISLNGTVRRI